MPVVLIILFILFFKLFFKLLGVAVQLALALIKLTFRLVKFVFRTIRKCLVKLAPVLDRHLRKNPMYVTPMSIFMSDERLFEEFRRMDELNRQEAASIAPGGKQDAPSPTAGSFVFTPSGGVSMSYMSPRS